LIRVASFDISSLPKFHPPTHRCLRCGALFSRGDFGSSTEFTCPICKLRYTNPRRDWSQLQFTIEKPLEHAAELAGVATLAVTGGNWSVTPLWGLTEAILRAQRFVHFTTWSIDTTMISMLRVASHRIEVCGVIGGPVNEYNLDELKAGAGGPPWQCLNLLHATSPAESLIRSGPHQKVWIIDGMLAFHGSTNATASAWRRAGQNLDEVSAATDLDDVRELNAKYFAPHYRAPGLKDESELLIGKGSNGAFYPGLDESLADCRELP
jgi:hypothetical protein